MKTSHFNLKHVQYRVVKFITSKCVLLQLYIVISFRNSLYDTFYSPHVYYY
jgi:hypothetical protein